MGKDEFLEEIRPLVSRILQKEVEPDTRLIDGGEYVDSINIVAMLLELEETYAISFNDDIELDFLEDVRSLANHVYYKTGYASK